MQGQYQRNKTLLGNYRQLRPKQRIVEEKIQTNFLCQILSKLPTPFISKDSYALCRCNKNQQGFCQLIIDIVNNYYDWKNDNKFKQAYLHYNKKNMEYQLANYYGLSQNEIYIQLNDIIECLQLTNQISEETKIMLSRVLINYAKHTIYYQKKDKIVFKNKIFIWLAIGIYYHIGRPSKDTFQQQMQQSFLFWSIDIIMDNLNDITQKKLYHTHCKQIISLLYQYFPDQMEFINRTAGIDIQKIIMQWLSQLMCGYMDLQSLGFYINSIAKYSWSYIYKLVLSYFQKRMQYINKAQLKNKSQILDGLINSQQQWPMIFCNATTFSFDRT